MQNERTEISRCNYYAMVCHTIMMIILTVAYAIETFAKHDREVWYFLIVFVLGVAPVIIEWVLFKKNEETTAVKHCIGYGFAVYYAFLMFTATSPLTFTYVLLMIMVISVFNDRAYAIKVNVGAIVLNIIQIVIGFNTGKLGYTSLATAEIQIALIVIMAIFSITQTGVLNKNNSQKLGLIKEQQEISEAKYTETMEIVEKMTKDINNMYAEISELEETINYTKDAMGQVTQGSTDMAEAVQNQLIQTQTIQNNLTEVDNASSTLMKEMTVTKSEIETGKVNMINMVEKVNETVESSREVASQLENLDEKIKEMNSIVGIINGITSKTALLSLNASIEAARAGEAGRGFAVVAGEISNMATQTKDATVLITDLINNVSGAISQVVTVIRGMIEGINKEKEITESTEASFLQIATSADVMNEKVTRLTEILEELITANTDIVDAISVISGVSEEVCAHATQTLGAEEENAVKLTEVLGLVSDLKELTKRL